MAKTYTIGHGLWDLFWFFITGGLNLVWKGFKFLYMNTKGK